MSKRAVVTPNQGLKQDSGVSPWVPWGWKLPPEEAAAEQRDLERLGTKTIHGLVVEGIHATHSIPAGKEGNDQPIMITEERWYSRELQTTVLNIFTDPRNEPRYLSETFEMLDLERTEPDPALFRVPEGYEVEDGLLPRALSGDISRRD